MKTLFLFFAFLMVSAGALAQSLTFDSTDYKIDTIVMPGGESVYCRHFVKELGDPCSSLAPVAAGSRILHIYEPLNVVKDSPIIFRIFCNMYRPTYFKGIDSYDVMARALSEGWVVCAMSIRGCGMCERRVELATAKKKKKQVGEPVVVTVINSGALPDPYIDLKYGIRYLKALDGVIPGNSQKIITVGSGIAGTMSAVLGLSGGSADYAQVIDAQDKCTPGLPDDVWASACYSPFAPDYRYNAFADDVAVNSIARRIVYNSARTAIGLGEEIPDSLGAVYFADSHSTYTDLSDYFVDFDLGRFLHHHISNQPASASTPIDKRPEYQPNFAPNGDTIPLDLRIKMSTPFSYVADDATVKARNWFVRQGANDYRHNLVATLRLVSELSGHGLNVDARIPWSERYTDTIINHDDFVEWVRGL